MNKSSASRRSPKKRGHRGETLATPWLRFKGYRILARRPKTHASEVDLVAAASFGPVCFIEVKVRGQARLAADSAEPDQQTRIAHAASLYLASRPGLARRCSRFDIIAIASRALLVHHRDVWRPDL
jgi:putative endonuclease